jgi:hypothetical protein
MDLDIGFNEVDIGDPLGGGVFAAVVEKGVAQSMAMT